MNIQVLLFKDSNCDLCKLQQQEFLNNPPAADLEIIHVNREHSHLEERYAVDKFPTTVIIDKDKTDDYDEVINVFIGFVNTDCVDINIKAYETKCVV